MSNNHEQTEEQKQDAQQGLSYWKILSITMISSGLVTFAVLCVVFFAPEMLPISQTPPPEVVQRVDTLSTQVANLDNKVKSIEQKSDAIKPGLIQNRLSSLEARLGELSGSTEKMQDVIKGLSEIRQDFKDDGDIVQTVTKMSKLVTTLDSRVETISEENAELKSNLSEFNADDIKAANMLLVATQFEGSVERGKPFADELQAIQALFNTDPETLQTLDKLSPFANQGVPDKQTLIKELDDISNQLVKAALADDRDTVRNTLKSKLNKYVKIYKQDSGLPFNETQNILRRARNSLERGDVDGAIIALSQIEGPASSIIEPFFNKAQAQVLAERLSDKLSDKAIDFIRENNIGNARGTTNQLY